MAFPEHWLHWTWLIPGYLCAPLKDVNGRSIDILERGELNVHNGPDILNARIRVGSLVYLGDVEFHLHPEDWYRHGHGGDRRYRQVILHGVWELRGGVPARLQERFPHVCLSSQLALSREDWQQAMETLEGYVEAAPGSGGVPPPELDDLARFSLIRLERKTARFARWAEAAPLGEVFWRGLAEALGYTRNAAPMAALMASTPVLQLAAQLPGGWPHPLALWVYFLIRGGFWTGLARHQAGIPDSVAQLAEGYLAQGLVPALQLTDWHFSRLRPGNHPLVRLAALAQLLANAPQYNLFSSFLALAQQRRHPRQVLEDWEARLIQPLSPSLRQALRALLRWSRVPEHTLGRQRARQILLNVALPVLLVWARRTGNPGFSLYLESLYEVFPGCEDPGLFQRKTLPPLPREFQLRLKQSGFLQQGFLEWLHLHHPAVSLPFALPGQTTAGVAI